MDHLAPKSILIIIGPTHIAQVLLGNESLMSPKCEIIDPIDALEKERNLELSLFLNTIP